MMHPYGFLVSSQLGSVGVSWGWGPVSSQQLMQGRADRRSHAEDDVAVQGSPCVNGAALYGPIHQLHSCTLL